MPNSVGSAPPPQQEQQTQRRAHPGRANFRGPRGSPSTMSLSECGPLAFDLWSLIFDFSADDHWDQYLLKASRAGPSNSMAEQTSTLVEARLRRNRPSLMRQCEVLGVSGAGGDSPVGTMVRKTKIQTKSDLKPRKARKPRKKHENCTKNCIIKA